MTQQETPGLTPHSQNSAIHTAPHTKLLVQKANRVRTSGTKWKRLVWTLTQRQTLGTQALPEGLRRAINMPCSLI